MREAHTVRKWIIWLFWIAVWQAVHILINNIVIFVGPLDMMAALLDQGRRLLDHPFPLLFQDKPGIFVCLWLRDIAGGFCLCMSSHKGAFRASHAPGQICPCSLLCHPGSHMDRFRQSFRLHFLPGGSSHDLWRYAGRT